MFLKSYFVGMVYIGASGFHDALQPTREGSFHIELTVWGAFLHFIQLDATEAGCTQCLPCVPSRGCDVTGVTGPSDIVTTSNALSMAKQLGKWLGLAGTPESRAWAVVCWCSRRV